MRYTSQPPEIAAQRALPVQLHTDQRDDTVSDIAHILSHRKRGRRYQFLALPRVAPFYEAY